MNLENLTLNAVLIAIVIVLAALGVWWLLRFRAEGELPAPPAQPRAPETFEQTLRALHATGDWDAIWRLLDRALPEWPVSSSLIEVSRAVGTLEQELAAFPTSSLSHVVTERLTMQTQGVADALWPLADRIVTADRAGSSLLRDQLAQEDIVLMRLLPAIREARTELAELALADGRAFELRRAEGRFLALAATARELRTLGPEPPR